MHYLVAVSYRVGVGKAGGGRTMLGTLKHCHLELDSVADRNKPLPQMCYFLEFGGSRSARKMDPSHPVCQGHRNRHVSISYLLLPISDSNH